MIETIDEAYAYLESLTNYERHRLTPESREYRLDRMEALLSRYDDPHRGRRIIHVAGTKGKGSTAALISSALQAGGYRVGLYASPHVSSYGERINVDGSPVDDALVTKAVEGFRRDVESGALGSLIGGAAPTTFELLTLLAFLVYRSLNCDWLVIEVGIGGRLDCTNVVDPVASVITALDLEHTQLLGNSYQSIAREKGGIIKQGRPVFCAAQPESARRQLRAISREKKAPITFVDEATVRIGATVAKSGTQVDLHLGDGSHLDFQLGLIGAFQAENAALAYLTLSGVLPDLALEAYHRGFSTARLPGRMELTEGRPPIVLDGAHTPLAAQRVLEAWKTLFGGDGVLLFGSVEGKNAAEMARILGPQFRDVVISTPGTFKPSDPEEVRNHFATHNPRVILEPVPSRALETARRLSGGERPILVTGSFYMLGEIRGLVFEAPSA